MIFFGVIYENVVGFTVNRTKNVKALRFLIFFLIKKSFSKKLVHDRLRF